MEMINKNNIYIIDFQKYANDEAYSLYRYKDGITELIEESVVYYK